MSENAYTSEGFKKWLTEKDWHPYGPKNPKNPLFGSVTDEWVNHSTPFVTYSTTQELFKEYRATLPKKHQKHTK
jgi:hypothetical protein